jgi:ABC-type glutathione transport system ATPase component
MSETSTPPLLRIEDLAVEYPTKGWRSRPRRVIDGVSLTIAPGETLGLVGESGSGKTTIGRALLGLAPVASGTITYDGREVQNLQRKDRRSIGIQAVFQDPYTSLNPVMSVGEILAEPLLVQGVSRKDARARVKQLLDRVALPSDAIERLPREFSGGQRQRIAIARALALKPKLIVCDEPVSALDLSTQATVMDLFIELQETTGVSYLFVSHDLSVIRHISHRVAVLFKGEIVETGTGRDVTSNPTHPYTQRLLMASPVPDPDRQRARREAFELAARV